MKIVEEACRNFRRNFRGNFRETRGSFRGMFRGMFRGTFHELVGILGRDANIHNSTLSN